jgi:hypothetical protein
MLVASLISGTGSVRRFEAVECVRLVGNSVQLGEHSHSIASYAAGLWFFGTGHETFERLEVENQLEIHLESPLERRFECLRQADRVEVVDAEIRLELRAIAHLDDLLQNWYVRGSSQAWPVVVFQCID